MKCIDIHKACDKCQVGFLIRESQWLALLLPLLAMMDSHSYIISVLCVLGFFKEFKPSDPFVSPFLNGPKNFTESEITNEIYPIGTYSYMSLLILIFLLTDFLKYKPILLLESLSGIVTWSLLLWANGIHLIQLSQVSYGLYSACEVAYSAYLYAKIDKKHYQKATGQTKASLLIAKASSGFIAQMFLIYQIMDYVQLNYITLSAVCAAGFVACFLPSVQHSSFFNRIPESALNVSLIDVDKLHLKLGEKEKGSLLTVAKCENVRTINEKPSYSLTKIFVLWKDAMRNKHTLKWSIWSSLSLCGYLQVSYYIQLLWQSTINAQDKNVKIYHGFSNSFNSLAGALCTYGVGYLKMDWTRYGAAVLAISAIIEGGLILFASYMHSGLMTHYIIFALFKILYQTTTTIVSSEIAKSLATDSYGIVFGGNQFFALVLQSALTALVTQVLHLDIRSQFFLYGSYFVFLGIGFSVLSIATLLTKPTQLTVIT